jgi:hypothetical protein
MRFRWIAAPLLLTAAACGSPATPVKSTDYSGPATPRSSTAVKREKVAISVYNGNFGLVREVREVDLAQGKVELSFHDVAEHVQPETVHLRAVNGPPLTVLEQNYRYDLLTPDKLLEKHVGKKVRLHRWSEQLGKEESFDAEVLSFNDGQAVYRINGEVTYNFPGRVSFPEIPKNLSPRPMLVWLLGTAAPKQKVEVTYLTSGLTWKADYVLTVDEKDSAGDLLGWVTLTNQSGTSYDDAELKLVAGDVQKVSRRMREEAGEDEDVARAKSADASGFKEEGFFEYHLYTLGRKTSLLEKEQKQVSLLEAAGMTLSKKLVFAGSSHYYRGHYGSFGAPQKVGVFLEIENSEKNRMGMALPKGVVRVYKADKSGAKQFIGEDNIDHTPRDEKIRIKMGEAFDVVGERKQMAWRSLGSCTSESDWEVSIRNHKDGVETVELVEPIGGDWSIVHESHPHKRKDAHTFIYEVKVPARGETKVIYTARVKWC